MAANVCRDVLVATLSDAPPRRYTRAVIIFGFAVSRDAFLSRRPESNYAKHTGRAPSCVRSVYNHVVTAEHNGTDGRRIYAFAYTQIPRVPGQIRENPFAPEKTANYANVIPAGGVLTTRRRHAVPRDTGRDRMRAKSRGLYNLTEISGDEKETTKISANPVAEVNFLRPGVFPFSDGLNPNNYPFRYPNEVRRPHPPGIKLGLRCQRCPLPCPQLKTRLVPYSFFAPRPPGRLKTAGKTFVTVIGQPCFSFAVNEAISFVSPFTAPPHTLSTSFIYDRRIVYIYILLVLLLYKPSDPPLNHTRRTTPARYYANDTPYFIPAKTLSDGGKSGLLRAVKCLPNNSLAMRARVIRGTGYKRRGAASTTCPRKYVTTTFVHSHATSYGRIANIRNSVADVPLPHPPRFTKKKPRRRTITVSVNVRLTCPPYHPPIVNKKLLIKIKTTKNRRVFINV